MRRLCLIGAAALAIASWSTLSFADGMQPAPRRAAPPQAAPAQPATNWTGGQFGGHGGGSQLGQSFAEPGSNICPANSAAFPGGVSGDYDGCRETFFGFNSHPASATLGAFLGYRWQLGNFVAGVEGDFSWKDASKSSTLYKSSTVLGPDCCGGTIPYTRSETFNGKQSQGWDGSVRGRLGVLVSPTVLAYATGGVAFGEVCGSYGYYGLLTDGFGAFQASAGGAAKWCETKTGYTVGGGLEMALFQGWKARLEYRFTDFGDYTKNVPLSANAGAFGCSNTFNCNGNARIDLNDNNFHTVRIGIALDL